MKTENSKKLKTQKSISILITIIGIVLMIFMIITEDEPGAIPLLMIGVGLGWYLIIRFKVQSQHM